MDDHALRFGRFRLDPVRSVLLHDGAPVRIGPRATSLLLVLVQRRRSVVSKAELFDLVWPGLVVEENNLQQHISALRKVFGPEAIVTVPGRGYMFTLAPEGELSTAGDVGREAAPDLTATSAAAARVREAQLPAMAPLIGRESEIADLGECLREHAVVTVVGPGGIGKTRLALVAAHACKLGFAGGVWLTDLSVLTDGGQVAMTVANALGIVLPMVPAPGATRAGTIAAALRGQDLMLVLDNCEHMLEHVAELVDALRQRAPRVRVLATSQEPLHVVDEQVFRLAPLALPDPADAIADSDGRAATRSGAVQLFIARAQAVDRRFSPTPDVLPAVVNICRRLDGLPLAIELAAARMPLLGVQGLQQRLDERLGVLGKRPGRGPMRQQTIHAALSWSHALLTREEQIIWRRLAVFSGGFSLDLAHRVLVDADFTPGAVLDHLGALVDKSLLMADAGDDPRHLRDQRYRLLEPARAFALAQLDLADELDAMRLRHARALGDLLKSYDNLVVNEKRFDVLMGRLQPELDNLRAAMQWLAGLLAHPSDAATVDPGAARLLAITLAAHGDWLWSEVDSFGEGLKFCRLARDCLDDAVPVTLGARLRLAHQLLARTRLRPAAEWAVDAPLALLGFREVGDRVGLYRALCALGGAPRAVVGDDESLALLREAELLEAPDWSPVLRRRRQAALEWCHDQGGRMEACREAGLRSAALAREAGGVGEIAALGNLADTEFALGLVDDAIASCRRAIAVATELGRPEEAFNAFQHMVPALLERGSLAEAEAAILQGRAQLVRSLGSASGMLMPLALLAFKRGQGRLALQLVGCADRARADEGLDLHSPERRIREAVLAGMRSVLPAAEMSALLAEGALWDGDAGFARGGVG
ncbi:ATP-binding protein [Roseateles toxinivorans]|uniref:Putative ATPase n=1 Tax=Roseateles toxinivorans TaxID=270368 RepID=A0A4R6QL64_9BURK|nr:winged helix-turn-helix domain-containing protein [Roseateles toxinivorans]TDP63962.1 putative ATPase [Roseateles toxinivorans]